MSVEMFPLNEPMTKVLPLHCALDADCFRRGYQPTEDWMGDQSVFFWQTIRDLMLSGF